MLMGKREERGEETGETLRKPSQEERWAGTPGNPPPLASQVVLPSSRPVRLEAARCLLSHSLGSGVPRLQLCLRLDFLSHGQPSWSFHVSEMLHR